MPRIALWALITVLGMPVIATAEDARVPANAGNPAVEARPPAKGPAAEYFLPGRFVRTIGRAYDVQSTKFWIGLSCAPVDEALRSQLGLEAGSGLVIQEIADGSPARDAGLAMHDVITEVKIGDAVHKLADVGQLTSLVQQAEGKPIAFALLRHGKPLTVTVTPQNTPVRLTRVSSEPPHPLFFRMAGPVVALALEGSRPESANLPDDLTVVITKSGGQPVQIKVLQKDRGEWGLREKETAVQPEYVSQAVVSVMGHLSRLVGRMDLKDGRQVFRLEPGPQASFGVSMTAPSREGAEAPTPTPVSPAPMIRYREAPIPFSLQQRLDELQKQQEQVTKALDELRQALQKSQPQN